MPVWFISDAHLGSSADPATDEPRLARLLPFLERVTEARAEHLYILGDLFDFWFEYAHVMPRRHFRILSALRDVVAGGVPVTFLGGNHDWWVGKTFAETLGLRVARDPISVTHQGVRLYLAHGDGLASKHDSGYLLLKAILRNPVVVAALRLVHPDLAYSFGFRLSKFSRHYLTEKEFRIAERLGEVIDARLAEGHDAFLMGHLHTRHRERRKDGELFVLGDWMTIFSALRLEEGRLVWEDWSSGTAVDVPEPSPTIRGGHGDEPVLRKAR
ncbi:MAG: UDP-2,3-diacylglucosamine diphosphatase [bacterium]